MSSAAEPNRIGVVYIDKIGIIGDTDLLGLGKVQSIIDKYNGDKNELISILSEIQKEYGWIPRNAMEYVAKKVGIPISRLHGTMKKEERPKARKQEEIEYYPECKECGTRLTKEPFTDLDTVVVRSFWCPECGKENWFYIDLDKMFKNKNNRTKSRTNKERSVEYYPRCPDCKKIISQKPFTDLSTVSVVELYCSQCDKSHWVYLDLEKIFGNKEVIK